MLKFRYKSDSIFNLKGTISDSQVTETSTSAQDTRCYDIDKTRANNSSRVKLFDEEDEETQQQSSFAELFHLPPCTLIEDEWFIQGLLVVQPTHNWQHTPWNQPNRQPMNSTTELGLNNVTQHRNQRLSTDLPNKMPIFARKPKELPKENYSMHPPPPSNSTVAWEVQNNTSSMRNTDTGTTYANHYPKTSPGPQPERYGSVTPSTDRTFQSMGLNNRAFQQDEGELLIPPPPKTSDVSGRQIAANTENYVPSKPIDRPSHPRSKAFVYPQEMHHQSPAVSRAQPVSSTPLPGYQPPPDYYNYSRQPGEVSRRVNTESTHDTRYTNNELRSACNRLFSPGSNGQQQQSQTPRNPPRQLNQPYEKSTSPTTRRSNNRSPAYHHIVAAKRQLPPPKNTQHQSYEQNMKQPGTAESPRANFQSHSPVGASYHAPVPARPVERRPSAPEAHRLREVHTGAAQRSKTPVESTANPRYSATRTDDRNVYSSVSAFAKLSPNVMRAGENPNRVFHDKLGVEQNSSGKVEHFSTNPSMARNMVDSANHHWLETPEGNQSIVSSRSVTPPLPPLSPSNTPPITPPTSPRERLHPDLAGKLQTKTPDLLTTATQFGRINSGKKHINDNIYQSSNIYSRPPTSRGRTSQDVSRDSGLVGAEISRDKDSVFRDYGSEEAFSCSDDGDESVAIESNDIKLLRRQMSGLESMYSEVLKVIGTDRENGPAIKDFLPGAESRRSIASSVSSISRRGGRFKPSNQQSHRHNRKEFRQIYKRFQRLESHVVTLARSVAHLSSEMRTHNKLAEDVEDLKRQVHSLSEKQETPHPTRTVGEWERFRGWVPQITNPKRVKKLTKFFGQEPLLQIFLERLGYKNYIPNFEKHKIGILELPYMNEEKLEKIGIPEGPRQRILQESQMSFRQENFNIYIV